MKHTMFARIVGRILLILSIGVVLLLPATASANSPGPARERPLADFASEDFWVPEDCGGPPVPYLHIPMPLDLTTSWDVYPSGYYLAFRSHGMLPDPGAQMKVCQLEQWLYANEKLPLYEGTMKGQIMERPLSDGTAVIHATLHYQDLPFRVYPLNIVDACQAGTCNTDLYKPIVVNGRMSMQQTLDIPMTSPGALISVKNMDWSKPWQSVAMGKGVGTFTGEGGFPKGKTALVRLTEIGTTGRALGNPHWDGFPVEKIEITVQK